MQKHILFVLFGLMAFIAAPAQDVEPQDNPKCNIETRHFLRLYHQSGKATASKAFHLNNQENKVSVVLYCYNREQTLRDLSAMHFTTRIITPTIITADVDIDSIEAITRLASVRQLHAFDRHSLLLKKARDVTGVDSLQSGIGLETPYTGKGVVIGIIDQGFQYSHPAFRVTEDSVRIAAVWNLAQSVRPAPVYDSKTILSLDGDGLKESHGTHVTGIAAGGHTLGHADYYGMAPEADIVMIPTKNFSNADIADGITLIRQVAAKKGEPFVVNMSFGSVVDPHDGTDNSSLLIDSLARSGGIYVAAAGNSGDETVHAFHTFTSPTDTCLLLPSDGGNETYYIFLESNDTTSFAVTPLIYNKTTHQLITRTATYWKRNGYQTYTGINPDNQRYYKELVVNVTNATSSYTTPSDYYVALQLTGHTGQSFHAWIGLDGSYFVTSETDARFTKPDTLYTVGPPSTARSVISVGSFTTLKSWKSIDGKEYSMSSDDAIGGLSYFSSVGPSTSATLLKPEVCAPGSVLISSIKKASSEYQSSDKQICATTTIGTTPYYYGVMQGTSMSCPVVTGIIALWLQANPSLTHDQILSIIRRSSTQDAFTGALWNPSWGYGKINAYRGLRLALKTTGIESVSNGAKPISLLKEARQWRILFGDNESFARIFLRTLDGRTVMQRQLTSINRGDEEVVSLSGLTPGIYIITIQTLGSTTSRKVIVR